jgi:exonuclease SbcC
VVKLGAPSVEEGNLAAAWEALASWAARQHTARRQELDSLETGASGLRERLTADAAALRTLLAEHGITGLTDLAKAPAAVAQSRTQAVNDLNTIRRDRDKAARLDAQIRADREQEQVASELGRLLRATSFERWLCSEALDSLVAEASAILMELSGGQYELDRDDRNDLVVIDYQDAAASRPVHTLSGGETFQASLALALALSRQVVQLSAGMRDLNSVFLDEGFGTLDPETLDTVATTLERLAADKDRMVGLVTHVAALAERVPVRFVVSRDGTTSTLRKERV